MLQMGSLKIGWGFLVIGSLKVFRENTFPRFPQFLVLFPSLFNSCIRLDCPFFYNKTEVNVLHLCFFLIAWYGLREMWIFGVLKSDRSKTSFTTDTKKMKITPWNRIGHGDGTRREKLLVFCTMWWHQIANKYSTRRRNDCVCPLEHSDRQWVAGSMGFPVN